MPRGAIARLNSPDAPAAVHSTVRTCEPTTVSCLGNLALRSRDYLMERRRQALE